MNLLKSGTILLMLAFSFQVYSQQRCGTDEKMNEYLLAHPEAIQSRQAAEAQIQEWIRNNGDNYRGGVVTIPVVFHVVYKTNAQNISDSQIISQLDVLNKDYRRLNSDASQTPSQFQGIAADIEIEFCLASIDPDGNWTSGITRTQTTKDSWNGSDLVKYTDQGGKDAWNTSRYLNIWVCNIGGGYLGFSYLPGTVQPQLDGVVIGYRYVGTSGVAQAPYNKGRTLTHEIGHWLNLEHPWGFNETNSNCTTDDNVNDTPKQYTANYDCPSFPQVSCSNGPNGDMFMNYMDYTDDACMNAFTQGQKQRMLAALNSLRSGIVNNNPVGCNSVGLEEKVNFNESIIIYPNPATNAVTISMDTPKYVIGYRMYNSLGELVSSGNINEAILELNVANLPSGLYFIRLDIEENSVVKKVIISH